MESSTGRRIPLALIIWLAAACASPAPVVDTSDPYRLGGDGLAPRAVAPGDAGAAPELESVRAAGGRPLRVSGMAYPTGEPSTSALFVERATPSHVASGEELSYQLRVQNLTRSPLDDVVLTETIGGDFELGRADPAPDHREPGVLRWKFERLAPREERVVRVTGTAGRGPHLEQAASVTYRPLLRTVVRVDAPDLRVHLTAPTDSDWCEPIPLRLTVTNTGPQASELLHLRQPLPDGLTTGMGASTLDRRLAPLAAGESRAELFELVAAQPGTYALRATVDGGGGVSAPSNTVLLSVRAPELAVTLEAEPASYLGAPVRYHIAATNAGGGTARRALVEFSVPSGTSFLSASDGGRLVGDEVRWSLDRLHSTEARDLEVVLLAHAPGTVRAAVELRAACGHPARSELETDVLALPELELDVSDSADPAPLGEQVVYVVRVTNQGAGPVRDLAVSVRLDPALELVETTGPSAATRLEAELAFERLAELGPGEEARWRVVVRGQQAGEHELAARLDSTDLALPIDRREATDYYE